MKATALEFRLRMMINAVIIVTGVWAPWVPQDKRILLFEWLPLEIARLRVLPFSAAVPALLVAAGILAALGVLLRVTGAAYLGPSTVSNPDMLAGGVVANGPYRYVRNPLYLGVWCMIAGMAPLMPPSGAAFALVLLAVFLLRLTLGEEAFLSAQLGEPYRAYLRVVPRFLPRLRSNLPRSAAQPQWLRAILAELTPVGILVSVVVLAYTYDARLSRRVILVGFGLSLIAKAVQPRAVAEPRPTD
jgi:protein-S-isoprenylcysteine O-methyltransferase Ste14